MVQNIADMKLDSSISDDIENITKDMVDDVTRLRAIEKPKDGSTDEEIDAYNKSTKDIKKRIDDNRKLLKEIANGERLQHYFEEAYFNTRPLINKEFGVKTPNDFSESMFNKKYFELNDYERERVDLVSEEYETYHKRDKLRVSKKQFDNITNLIVKNRNKILDRLKESSPLTFDASKSLDRYERYMDIPTILQTNSFSELIDVYDNVMKQGFLPEDATEEEKENLSYIPTQTQYQINQEAFDKEKKELLSKNGADSLAGFDIANKLADLLIFAKYKGDKKILSPDQAKNIEETIKLKDVLGFISNDMLFKDFTKENVDQIRESKKFTDDQVAFVQKAFDLKQNIFDFSRKIVDQISEIQKNPDFVLGLLKDISLTINEKDESKELFNIYDLLEKETSKVTDPTFDLGGYMISKKIEENQIRKAIQEVKKLRISLHELTVFEGDEDTMYKASERVLALNKQEFDKKGMNFSQDQYIKIDNELKYYESKLAFFLEVSDQNKGNKIKYDKLASSTIKAKNMLSIFSNDDLDQSGSIGVYFGLEGLAKKDDTLFFEDKELNELKDRFYGLILTKGKLSQEQIQQKNFILDLNDNDILELEDIVTNIEERIYQLFNNGDIVDGKNTIINNFIEVYGGDEFRDEFMKKLSEHNENPTKYNPKVENYKDLDSLFHFLYVISYSPKKMNSYLIGNTEDGISDFEKSPYAPLQSQENAIRYALSMFGSSDQENMINRIFEKLELDYFDLDQSDYINKETDFSYGIKNAITVAGYPGAGKTTITE